MLPVDLGPVIERDHEASSAFVRGDPEPRKRMFSRADDVTLANPIGPPVRGWSQVEKTLEQAATQVHDGEPVRFERISEYASGDLAYIFEIERTQAKMGASDQARPFSLRVTNIYRRESEGWKLLHRHADPILAVRPMESVLEGPQM